MRKFPGAKLCHLWAWGQMVQRVSRHRSYYLVARQGQEIWGVLPLSHVKSRLFGNRLISVAYGNYGGILGSEAAREPLFQQAVALAETLHCESIEFRNQDPLPFDLQLRTDKVCMRLPLLPDPEELWNSFSKDSGIRKRVRKAEKSGITASSGRLELLDTFYSLYTLRMHQLGTPAYSKLLIRCILEFFPENSRIFLAFLDGKVIAGKLLLFFNHSVEAFYGVSLVEYNTLCSTHLLHWTAMQEFCRSGYTWFDFGRSTVGGGPYEFKKKWGTQETTLHWQYWVRPGHEISSLSPSNPRYQRKIEAWKKLPLWMARFLGPHISRGLP
ncbi:MAG: FemAB family PEP-CTERM system-associated protein [Phycisphaerae bacterium]|nr:FemAB family PEP-CTERM system-associated protein [Phycisphaerae bacterium]